MGDEINDDDNKNNNELINEKTFKFVRIRANTLQGRIYDAIDLNTGKQVIVKESWKKLYDLGISRDGHPVPEDFKKEKEIMSYLSKQNDANDYNFVKLIYEWEDKESFYYAMDACLGGELFTYIKTMHNKGAMKPFTAEQIGKHQHPMKEPNSWVRAVQSIWIQCVKTIWWMHQKGVVHLDISLENTMIDSRKEGTVKIIDFGLAKKRMPHGIWKMKQRVGKIGYMAPEVYNRQEYDPRMADTWSLGVMLFMMLVGAPPYEVPKPNNPAFKLMMQGKLRDILIYWKRIRLLTEDALDLLERIFTYEKNRISLDEILQHDFVGLKQWRSDWLKARNNNEMKVDKKTIQDKADHKNNYTDDHAQNESESTEDSFDITKAKFETDECKKYLIQIEKVGTQKKKLTDLLTRIEKQYNSEVAKNVNNKADGSRDSNKHLVKELDNIQKVIAHKIERIEDQPGSSLARCIGMKAGGNKLNE